MIASRSSHVRSARGFTLIELLIVIAIIGLLATLAVFAVGSARQRARDARRVSDIKQIQSALELFAVSNGGYPALGGGIEAVLGGAGATCLGDNGIAAACTGTTYMAAIPTNALPGGVDYVYESKNTDGSECGVAAGGVCNDYRITFEVEGATAGLTAGTHYACSAGQDCSAP